jgi:hypothetical protein
MLTESHVVSHSQEVRALNVLLLFDIILTESHVVLHSQNVRALNVLLLV